MHHLNELRLRAGGVQLEQHVVVWLERVVDGARAGDGEQPGERPARVGKPRVHRARERRGVGHAGPERRAGGAHLDGRRRGDDGGRGLAGLDARHERQGGREGQEAE